MSLDNIKDIFDFDNFDYFYHETSKGDAQAIMQQGLLEEETKIRKEDNILINLINFEYKRVINSYKYMLVN